MGMDTHPSSPRTEIDLMTEQELASHLKICRRQLYNWRVAGLIPYFKMGKARWIPACEPNCDAASQS
jgi:predicted site-specific integrase-resolvase